MKIPHFLILIPFLLCAGFAHAKLVFESTIVDQEAGLFDKELEVAFKFVNEGDQPITIKELKSSCGCTVAQLDKRTYAPGEPGEIRALFSFGSRSGMQRKQVTVVTSDQARQILAFTTRIPVWGEVSPRIIRWRVGEEPEPREVRIRIEQPDTIMVKSSNLDVSPFSVETVESGAEEWIFRVTPDSTEKRVTKRVTLVLEAREGENTGTREVAFHCLVR